MKVAIIGAGAVGLLYAIKTQERGHKVTLYARRQDQIELIRREGIQVGEEHTSRTIHIEDVTRLHHFFDLVILATKQTHVDEVVALMAEKKVTSPVLFLQNGMGHVDLAVNMPNPSAVGVVEHGVRKTSDRGVLHTGLGLTRIAAVNMERRQALWIKDQLDSKEFSYVFEEDWFEVLSNKLIVNAVINPITALFNIRNGEILENPYLLNIAKRLCEEACMALLKTDGDRQFERVTHIMEQTKWNRSSMLADVLHQRETEIEGISGYILEKCKQDLPYTSFVYEGLKGIGQIRRRENM
ncbi:MULTISPECIES: 2-dehydropantoate 2-reductase [Pontibacillus]|uniref:2-dehydropantoate 2-reductase n=1 Tax=Pontibacillus chungwhensis TaxID=265426 RepID=A0ABY8V5K0_9BACI|nr:MULTISPECIES: 2-dehydropantoate 2-reductase [Pontibacillus]WIF99864.1 2-dehydropantoate 2-reductase [Pontibacillus chungwhensis]